MEIKLIQLGEERLKNSKEQASPVVRHSYMRVLALAGGGGVEKTDQLINRIFTFVTDLKANKERYSNRLYH